ncbi:MAG: right-handed parallel beta-helix repeat-containing protein [Clostridia bacterium]|nr:right-handed parallel beta-helix repeat-containing protein [Clostridia bacterium]
MQPRALFLILALLTLILSSCESGDTTSQLIFTPLEDWQSYAIVRPDDADAVTVNAAVSLRKAIGDALGAAPSLDTDWVKRGAEPPSGTPEILVGATNRAESSAYMLKMNDYVIAYESGRIVLTGGCGEAVQAAVDWFAANCLTAEGISLPSEPYIVRGEYPLEGLTVGGVPLGEYTIDFSPVLVGGEDTAESLRRQIGSLTGQLPGDGASEHTIVLKNDPALGIFESRVTLDHGTLTLAVNGGSVGIEAAAEQLLALLEKNGSAPIEALEDSMKHEQENFHSADGAQVAAWRAQTDARIEAIRSASNMDIPTDAAVYYVSPDGDDTNDGRSPEAAWRTLEKLNGTTIPAGSYVCFERGGFWRGQLKAKAGVTYTAYGEGEKPVFTTSPEDGAGAEKWQKTDAEGVWQYYKAFDLDVGTLIFDGGEEWAIKVVIDVIGGVSTDNTNKVPFEDYHDLDGDLNFFMQDGILYIRSDKNPGERFDTIEFNVKEHGISVGGNNITIDNLCLLYVGAHGISAGSVSGLTVQNCELGWIGGVIQTVNKQENGDYHTVRYGNAIQIWGGCDGYTVTDCYIYQCYDTGITPQWMFTTAQQENKSPTDYSMKNIHFAGNVIEYCMYSIEYFLSNVPEGNASHIENYVIEDNHMWYAGYGLSEQRYNPGAASHIKGGGAATGYIVRNNWMILSKNMITLVSGGVNEERGLTMPTLENNLIAQTVGGRYGVLTGGDAGTRPFDLAVVDYLGELNQGNQFWFVEK